MNQPQILERMRSLGVLLNEYSRSYYVNSISIVSDAVYDSMREELVKLEAMYPDMIQPDSPTQRVGSDKSNDFATVKHVAPILSLSNLYDLGMFEKWHNGNMAKGQPDQKRRLLVFEPKLDGLTVVLTYTDGVLTLAATRGNGLEGDDVTANARTIRTIPLALKGSKIPDTLVVRGEVLIKTKDFETFRDAEAQVGRGVYANARNLASGSLKQKDSREVARRPLTCYVYDIVYMSGLPMPQFQEDRLKLLSELGFNVVEWDATNADSTARILRQFQIEREQLPYGIDGVVVKYNDCHFADSLGVSGKDPRGAAAYKYPGEEAKTKLLGIKVTIGRTGKIMPTADLAPVKIAGTTITSATLHNYTMIQALDLRIGDTVIIKKAGDVIPYIVGPDVDARTGSEQPVEMPVLCPSCQQPVTHEAGAADYFCTNQRCPERVYRAILHWINVLELDGISSGTITKLLEAKAINSLPDLYLLTEDDLKHIPGFGKSLIANFMKQIAKSKQAPYVKILEAIGIDGIGGSMSKQIAPLVPLETLRYLPVRKLLNLGLANFGQTTAVSINDWFGNSDNQNLISALKLIGFNLEHVEQAPTALLSNKLAGKTFLITGTLSQPRSVIEELIQQHGGTLVGSVSKKLNFLVVGESAGSKLVKAQELGITTIDEQQLLAMLN